jgi:pSer/pThr/pTyr-binding forkhead associated (FHA) protein
MFGVNGRDNDAVGTTTQPVDEPEQGGAPRLLVIAEGGVSGHLLPESGTVVIGRDPEADVQIDDPSVSRRHLELHLGEQIRVRDLGSSNGTSIGREKLAANALVDLPAAETLRIGSVILVLQLPPEEEAILDATEAERRRIIAALVRTGGNQTEAAKLVGMSRRTLVRRLEQLDVPRPRKRD